MLCRIWIAQIQPRKVVLDHAGYTAPTRQHELDHTDHTDQESFCALKNLDHALCWESRICPTICETLGPKSTYPSQCCMAPLAVTGATTQNTATQAVPFCPDI